MAREISFVEVVAEFSWEGEEREGGVFEQCVELRVCVLRHLEVLCGKRGRYRIGEEWVECRVYKGHVALPHRQMNHG
jgi:hypothetical protein